MRSSLTQSQARQLLHNKFVVILGGSVQRSMYKDLVLLLQRDQHLTLSQLKSKGELSFEQDILIEGGRLGPMTNGTEYREVRQYRTSHHLLRFYFLTQIYSRYVESILEDFRHGLKPDFIIISSCAWDITRYGLDSVQKYEVNLNKFFGEIKTVVCQDCVIVWALAMPIGKKIKGGFLVPEVNHLGPTLSYDIIEANFYGARLADSYGLDVLDLHFHFRLSLQHRMPDGVHWDTLAHRRISSLLLQHAADAWGVKLHGYPSPPQQVFQHHRGDFRHRFIKHVWSHPRPSLHTAPLPRSFQVQQQQCCLTSDWFQLAPPNPAATLHEACNLMLRCFRRQTFPKAGVCHLPAPPPLPDLDTLWLRQQLYPPVRAAGSQMDVQFNAGGGSSHFQSHNDFWRRRRMHYYRSHPYLPPYPLMTPRRPAYMW